MFLLSCIREIILNLLKEILLALLKEEKKKQDTESNCIDVVMMMRRTIKKDTNRWMDGMKKDRSQQ
jgi:hypothetical protein